MIDVKVLRAAGLSDTQIVRVLEADQAERIARQREQNRIRQRNQRLRNDVTRDQRDMRDAVQSNQQVNGSRNANGATPPSFFLSSSESQTLRQEKKQERKARARELSADWVPTERNFALGVKLGFSRAEVLFELDGMRSWTKQEAHRVIVLKADWEATFDNWLRRAAEKPRRTAKPKANLYGIPGLI